MFQISFIFMFSIIIFFFFSYRFLFFFLIKKCSELEIYNYMFYFYFFLMGLFFFINFLIYLYLIYIYSDFFFSSFSKFFFKNYLFLNFSDNLIQHVDHNHKILLSQSLQQAIMKDQLAICNAGIDYYCPKDLAGSIAKYHCFTNKNNCFSCVRPPIANFIEYCTFDYYNFCLNDKGDIIKSNTLPNKLTVFEEIIMRKYENIVRKK